VPGEQGAGRSGARLHRAVDLEAACRALGLEVSEDQKSRLLRYRDLLAEWSRKVDLVAPAGPEEVLRAHILDSLLLLVMADPAPAAWVVDVGSGAGLPGVVWAVARPDLWVVMLEPRRKRAAFVERVVLELGLRNAQAEPLRAEQAAKQARYARQFQMAVCRALGTPEQVARLARGLVRPAGRVVVPVGPQRPVRPPFQELQRPVPWERGKVRRVAVLLV